MGAQWKQSGRELNANKRGQIFSKLAKEIAVAAKLGDPNPANNARLRVAVEAAKKASVPRDTIERAIQKGAGLLDGQVNYELITYEGFAPHKVPVIVEALTDNKNRTAAHMRTLFRKGLLGSIGSVAWMFDRSGVVEATHLGDSRAPCDSDNALDIETAAIEAGAQNVEPLETPSGARFYTDPMDLDAVSKALTVAGWTITLAELSYIAKTPVEMNDDQKKEVGDFLLAIDDYDDVHRIYVALK